jgi:mono/diheme cytochrome c family protein
MKVKIGSYLLTGFCSVFLTIGVLFSAQSAEDTTKAVPTAGAPAAAAPAGDAADVAKGETIFQANCKQCHGFKEVVVGPALDGAVGRWPSEDALAGFIKYPQKTIEGGNAYAKGLYEKYKQYMPNHDFLSDADIKSVIAYIKSGGPKEVAAVAGAEGAAAGASEGGMSETSVNLILGILVLVLVIVLVVLVLMVNILTRTIQTSPTIPAEDRAFIEQKSNWGAFFGSPAFRTFLTWSIIFFLAKVGFDKTYEIGINQGYAPRQPIAFSHKLHAGMYEIDCNYCHTGVNRGRRATLPAVNICMNCHNAIKTKSPEIQKIWRAVRTHKPIEWVRVHNLPDLAYFNHAQHVKVGGVECKACHGDVTQMEVVTQHSTLTMGWCINCHRQTVVKADGNAYYDKLLILHRQTKKGDMHVADIGGLECSKCHY